MLIKELKSCKGHFTLKQIQQWDLDLSSVKFWPLFPRRKNIRPKKGQDNVIAVNKRSLLSVFPAKSCTTQVQTVTFTGWKNDGRGEGAEESQHPDWCTSCQSRAVSPAFLCSRPWRESLDVRECTSWSALSGIQHFEYSVQATRRNRRTHKGMQEFRFSAETEPGRGWLLSAPQRLASLCLQDRPGQGPEKRRHHGLEAKLLAQGTLVLAVQGPPTL